METSKDRGIKTRQRIYAAIVDYTQEHLYPPSVREIADMSGLKSSGSVFEHLKTMAGEGLIEIESCQPRCIKLLGYKLVKKEAADYARDKDDA